MSSGSIVATWEVCPLSPFLRAEGWGEGQSLALSAWRVPLTRISRKRDPTSPRKRGEVNRGLGPYSTGRLNLFDFGRPCASRPASARLPRQSVRSFQLMP